MTVTIAHHLLVVFLVLIFPLWDRRETRRLKADPTQHNRTRSYQKTIIWLWAATVLLLLTTPALILTTPPPSRLLAAMHARTMMAIVILAAFVVGLVAPVILIRRNPKALASQRAQLARIAFFLPHSRTERWWFAAVSISAGICEELIFRGFLIRYLDTVPLGLGLVGAVIVSALIFGLDHGYQGWTGMLTTSGLALFFTLLFFLAGRLWVPMIAHALLDLRILLFDVGGTPDAHAGAESPAAEPLSPPV
ncbi:MAG TPA: CPBP family intramembrane glutamic endopeptidase [Gemmatimonadaceae bacterium]|nr:CPBP family intramembrane glutamic endopeptidase [Gemmatimonadaceae bacterium]